MTSNLLLVRLAGFLGASGVSAGAYGSHLLEAGWQTRGIELDDADIARWKGVWNTGWTMHLSGASGTLGIAAAAPLLKRPTPVGLLVGGGTLLFSSSCYLAAYNADRKYAVGAPPGGSATILGWLLLCLAP